MKTKAITNPREKFLRDFEKETSPVKMTRTGNECLCNFSDKDKFEKARKILVKDTTNVENITSFSSSYSIRFYIRPLFVEQSLFEEQPTRTNRSTETYKN